MSRRARSIVPRRVIFLGCEGQSEQSYGVFIKGLADEARLPIHIEAYIASPAGDSLAIAQKVVARAKKGQVAFSARYVMLDADLAEAQPDKARAAQALLDAEGFVAIWQRPDHEGLLLRHFDGHTRDNPVRGRAEAALLRVWPGYRKNCPAVDLRARLNLESVWRAAAVTPELEQFLQDIGLPRP